MTEKNKELAKRRGGIAIQGAITQTDTGDTIQPCGSCGHRAIFHGRAMPRCDVLGCRCGGYR